MGFRPDHKQCYRTTVIDSVEEDGTINSHQEKVFEFGTESKFTRQNLRHCTEVTFEACDVQ